MITRNPGTAKTTLSAAFAEAAAKRGERTLYGTMRWQKERAEIEDRARLNLEFEHQPKFKCRSLPYRSPKGQRSPGKESNPHFHRNPLGRGQLAVFLRRGGSPPEFRGSEPVK